MLATGVPTPVGVKVYGPDYAAIEKVSLEVEKALKNLPDARSVYAERTTGGSYLDFVVDRDAAARYGLSMMQVENTLEAATGGKMVTTTVEGRRRFTVLVRYLRDYRSDLESLRRVLVMTPSGAQVPIAQLARIQVVSGPPMYKDENGRLAGIVYVDTTTSDLVGFVRSAQRLVAERVKLSAGVTLDWTGQFEFQVHARKTLQDFPSGGSSHFDLSGRENSPAFFPSPRSHSTSGGASFILPFRAGPAECSRDSYASRPQPPRHRDTGRQSHRGTREPADSPGEPAPVVLPIVFAVIFVLLTMTFRSMSEAMIVMLSVVYAMTGGVILQWLLGYNFSVAVWIGYIALYGIAVETGVVMVIYLHEALDKRIGNGELTREDIVEATREGSVLRLRPKLMTVVAAILSLLPIFWSTGTGSEVMRPIATPIVGGMITSTIHVLLVTPVIFLLMKERARKKGTLRASGMDRASGVAAAKLQMGRGGEPVLARLEGAEPEERNT